MSTPASMRATVSSCDWSRIGSALPTVMKVGGNAAVTCSSTETVLEEAGVLAVVAGSGVGPADRGEQRAELGVVAQAAEVVDAAAERDAAQPCRRDARGDADRVRVGRIRDQGGELGAELRPRGVAGEHDPVGVHVEALGVRAQPTQRGHELANGHRVARFGGERVARSDDDEPVGGEHSQVAAELILRSADEGAAVDPHHDRERGSGCRGRAGQIDVEFAVRVAVVALVERREHVLRGVGQLLGGTLGGRFREQLGGWPGPWDVARTRG